MEVELLRKLQKVETEILLVVDKFCKERNIKYTLGFGTLLGAVRHGGPIPWDDDVDICMLRNDYDRFIKLWKESNMQGFYLQEAGKYSDSHINHTKIRKDGTILASDKEFNESEHQGVWIDIFVLDKIPNEKKLRKKMLFWAKIRLIYTRNYPIVRNGKIIEFVSRLMLMLPLNIKKMIKNYSEDYIVKYKDLKDDYSIISLAAPYMLKEYYPKEIMDSLIEMKYSEYKFWVVKEYDQMLKIRYGDYMKFPPLDEQKCKHNPTHIRL